jgi:hypothetical protein
MGAAGPLGLRSEGAAALPQRRVTGRWFAVATDRAGGRAVIGGTGGLGVVSWREGEQRPGPGKDRVPQLRAIAFSFRHVPLFPRSCAFDFIAARVCVRLMRATAACPMCRSAGRPVRFPLGRSGRVQRWPITDFAGQWVGVRSRACVGGSLGSEGKSGAASLACTSPAQASSRILGVSVVSGPPVSDLAVVPVSRRARSTSPST